MRSTTATRLAVCAAASAESADEVWFFVSTASGRMVSVLGEYVDVAPHLGVARFAVHQAVGGESGWVVSDVVSGGKAGPVAASKAAAIKGAADFLVNVTPTAFLLAVERLQKDIDNCRQGA